MSKIVPKLNLNKTPQLVDNNSLIMAKNIRLLDDGTIGPDTSVSEILTNETYSTRYDYNFTILNPKYTVFVSEGGQTETDIVKHIINSNNGIDNENPIYFRFNGNYACENEYFLNTIGIYDTSKYSYSIKHYDYTNNVYKESTFKLRADGNLMSGTYRLRVCISTSNSNKYFYIALPSTHDDSTPLTIQGDTFAIYNPVFVISNFPRHIISNINDYISQIVGLDNKIYFIKENKDLNVDYNDRIKIYEYDEIDNTCHIISCGWKYSGGKINGCVTVNNRGDKILTINEYGVENKNIPIKYINLSTCRIDDDESIYTQSPKLPITNLLLSGYYVKTIPLGVYQFFIRYKISDYNYTQWLPCSGELPIGNDYRLPTIQGTVKYVDFHEQSQYSFVFTVQHLFEDYKNIYKSFQLGFIVSSEGGIFARSWKHFNMSTSKIYFGINTNEIEDINIDDLLKVNYELFNVENIAFFKNKLYISNYKETDFNEDLSSYSKDINVDFKIEKIPFEISESLYLNDRKIQYENDSVNNKIIINKIEDEPINITFNDISIIKNTPTNLGSPTGIQPLPFYYISDHLGPQLGSHPDYLEFTPTSPTYNLLPQPGSIIEGSLGQTHINSDIFKKYIDKSIINKVWLEIEYPNGGTSTTENVYLFGFFNNTPSNFIDTSNPNKYINLNTTEESIINQEAVARLINNIRSYIVNYSGSIQSIQINKSTFKYLLNDSSYDNKIKNATSIKFYYTYSKCVNEVLFTGRVLNEGSGRTTYTDYNGFAFRRIDSKVRITFNFVGNIRNPQEGEFDVNLRKSLLPFTKYDFYVHYLKDNGIVTNGNYIGSKELDYYNDGYYTIDKTNWAAADISSASFSSLIINNITYTREGSGTTANPYVYKTDNSILTNSKEVIYYNPSDSTQYLVLSLRPANTNSYIYPIFSNIRRPGGYVACFISIYKSGNDVAEIFNIVSQSNAEEGEPTYSFKGDCIEVDALLYPVITNLDIKNYLGDVTYERKGKYIPSSSVNPVQIGKIGKIQCNTGSTNPQDTRYWLILNNSHEQSNEQKELTKVTPYIVLSDNPVQYTNYENLNLPGTLSKVVKPNNIDADKYYVNGGIVYKSDSSYTPQPSDPTNIIQFEKVTSHIDLIGSYVTEYVHSNFNLDCISLRNDINQYLIDIGNSGKSQLVYAIDSDLISLLYELKSIYIDYTKKLYRITTNNNKTVFNNTIRCSNNNVDEYIENIYLFDATDYYNIPSNRGIITNLVSIANTLYVHCEHTLYRFTDNKELNSNNEEITLQETDIFNSGISEIFDAKYGYAGLKKREHSLVTYNAYIFYDDYVKTIYYFDGQNKLSIISQPIKKILSNIDIIDVKFVADEQHNRFFINILIDTIVSGSHVTKNLCLSFNFNAQSFVSIHDINFVEGFHTRSNTYFIAEKYTSDVLTNWYVYKVVDYVLNGQNIAQYVSYANCYKKSIIEISDCDTIGNNPINSCIDVVVNTEYEKVKQLDYVNWICSEISQYGFNNNLVSEEIHSKIYPGNKIRIYSDITNTELVSLVDNNGYAIISNDKALDNPNSWKNIRYNCGIWSMNYFRDISHRTDIFDYNENVPLSNSRNLHQEDSLIYGKYFIIRFIFTNRNFKIENIILKMNDYGKTK